MKGFKKTVLLLLTVLLLVGGTLYAQEGTIGAAYIRELTGTVEIKTSGSSEWRAAVSGEVIQKDTMISTGFNSSAQIVLGNSTVIVRPLTRLSFAEIQNIQGEESVNLYLRTGRVRAEVNPPEKGRTDFTVQSPTVTASVRGTSFEFNGEDLSVDAGRVHVTGGDGSAVYVGSGRQVFSNPETGKTEGAVDAALADLTPALPIMAGGETPKATEIAPSGSDLVDTGFGVDWN
jgi:hypothetical protein